MRLIASFVLSWIAIVAAWAGAGPNMLMQTLSNPPSWVLYGASTDLNFANQSYWNSGMPSGITITRASVGYIDNQAGFWVQVPANQPRISDKGLLVEQAMVNNLLWSRDMTNVAWTKSNMTNALTGTGIDGSANSATTLAASAGNGTVLQSITLVSAAHTYSVFLKRVTGTGTINITIDNGSTWTPCTVTTTAFTLCQVTATAANPVQGIQIVTSGDSVIADFNQMEISTWASTPILTTTTAATRQSEVVSLTTVPPFGVSYSLFASATPLATAAFANSQVYLDIDDGTSNNRAFLERLSATAVPTDVVTIAGGATILTLNGGTHATGVTKKYAISVVSGAQNGSFDGSAVVAGAGAGLPATPTNVRIGNNSAVSVWANGYIPRVAIWRNSAIGAASLQAVTK